MNEIEVKKYFKNFWREHPYKTIKFKDEKWSYILSGNDDNPPIILIHGGFVDAGMWAYQIQELEKDFKVLAPTFPFPPRSFRYYCGMLNSLMQHEKIDTSIICGISYGGLLCQYFAKYYPNRITKLILSHTFKPNIKFVNSIKLKSFILQLIPKFIYEKKFQKRINERDATDWMRYRRYYFSNIFHSYSQKEFSKGYIAMANSILEDPLEKGIWQGPTIIFSSKDDEDVKKYHKEFIKTYPQAERYEFEKGGHHTALTDPTEYTKVLKKYLT